MNNKKDKRELFQILDEALDRALKGEDIHIILADYPRYADEIEPLLNTALAARNAAALKPRPEFRQRAGLEFQRAISAMPVKSRPAVVNPVKSHRGIFGWGTAGSVSVALILAVLLSGTGVVTAANYAMPDNPLYTVKLATESVQLALTPSSTGKAELLTRFNDRRVAEVVDMAGKGNSEEISVLNTRITNNINKISEISGNEAGTLTDSSGQVVTSSYGQTFTDSGQGLTAASAPVTTLAALTVTIPPETETVTPAATTKPLITETKEPVTPTLIPQPTVTPTITVATPPAAVAAPPAAASNGRNSDDHSNVKSSTGDKWQKIRDLLTEKQYKNLHDLLVTYERSSDKMKPSILKSIKIIINGYGLSPQNQSAIMDILTSYGLTMDQVNETSDH